MGTADRGTQRATYQANAGGEGGSELPEAVGKFWNGPGGIDFDTATLKKNAPFAARQEGCKRHFVFSKALVAAGCGCVCRAGRGDVDGVVHARDNSAVRRNHYVFAFAGGNIHGAAG